MFKKSSICSRKVSKSFPRAKNKKKREYCCERYKNLSEDEKQKLVEYRRNYFITLKNYLQGCSIRFQFLAIRVDRNTAISGQLEPIDIKYFEFLY